MFSLASPPATLPSLLPPIPVSIPSSHMTAVAQKCYSTSVIQDMHQKFSSITEAIDR